MSEQSAGPAPSRRHWSARQGAAILALLVIAYLAAFALYPNLFFVLGVAHYNAWFLDTFALLASNDAVSRGLDPYAPNPLDYFNRPHVYTHWWLHLRDLGLTRADSMRLGLGLGAAFVVTVLARLRPRSARELLWYLAVLFSSPIVLAVDRGNNDLVIFVLLAFLVPCLVSTRRGVRLLAPFLVIAATLLKFYPAAAALVLLAPAERDELRPRILITGLLLVWAGLNLSGDLAGFGARAPQPEGLMSFGAAGFLNELGWKGWGPKAVGAAIALSSVIIFWRRKALGDWQPGPAQRSDSLYLILGAVLLTGCFFTSMNFAYRWVFAIWLAPALWRLPKDPDTPPVVRRLARVSIWLLLVVLWWTTVCTLVVTRCLGELPASTSAFLGQLAFLIEQPFDWALMLSLLAFLVHFARRRLPALIASG